MSFLWKSAWSKASFVISVALEAVSGDFLGLQSDSNLVEVLLRRVPKVAGRTPPHLGYKWVQHDTFSYGTQNHKEATKRVDHLL